MSRTRILRWSITLAIPIVGLTLLYFYLRSYQYLTVTVDQSTQALIYKTNAADKAVSSVPTGSPSKILAATEKIKLKKGYYIITSKASNDYKTFSTDIHLSDTPQTITVKPDYNDQRLAALLKAELPLIEAAINAKYPTLSDTYSIDKQKLYKRGEWCGVKLIPENKQLYDKRGVILKKARGKWAVITDPPEIVIGTPVYPNIPKEILRAVNSL